MLAACVACAARTRYVEGIAIAGGRCPPTPGHLQAAWIGTGAKSSSVFHRRPKTQQTKCKPRPEPHIPTTLPPPPSPTCPPVIPEESESIPPEQPHPTPQLSLAPLRYSLSSTQYQTRGKRLRHGAGASLCFFLPLSLNGPEGEGEKGGEGSALPVS